MNPKSLNPLRWSLRIITGLCVLFTVFIGIGEMLEPPTNPNHQPITADAIFQLTVFGIGLAGFALAWKWELIGGVMALISFIGMGILNTDVFTTPVMYVMPAAALLFIYLGWESRKAKATNKQTT